MKFKFILTAIKLDITDKVLDSAKKAGATGATIINARGTGVHEAKTFFGLTLEAQTDIIMIISEEHMVDNILNAIKTAGQFEKPGTGVAFVVPIDQVVGLESQVGVLEEQIRQKYF